MQCNDDDGTGYYGVSGREQVCHNISSTDAQPSFAPIILFGQIFHVLRIMMMVVCTHMVKDVPELSRDVCIHGSHWIMVQPSLGTHNLVMTNRTK